MAKYSCDLKREERVCGQCTQQEVKNEKQFLLWYGHVAEKKREVMESYNE